MKAILICVGLYMLILWWIIRACQWIAWIDQCDEKITREFLKKHGKLKMGKNSLIIPPEG